jgi:hypothetical protein
MARSEQKKKKTLIPAFSRKREKERTCASLFLSPLPLAGEGRVRVFLLPSQPLDRTRI